MADKVFCSRNDVKLNAPINSGWTGYDSRIDALIVNASETIRIFCRRSFDQKQRIEYFRTPDTFNNLDAPGYKLWVAEPPIAADSVTIDYDASGMFTSDVLPAYITLTENTDYVVDYDSGIVEFFTLFDPNKRGLRVTYTGGYAVGAEQPNPIVQVPATIKQCCALQTVFLLQRIASMSLGEEQQQRASRSLNRFSVSSQTGLLSELQGMLASYRRPLIGR